MQKMINFDDVTKEKILQNMATECMNVNNWRFCIWKNKFLLNLINHQQDIDKIYLYGKDPFNEKYHI